MEKKFTYEVHNFQQVYDTHQGKEIWDYLTSHDAIIQMKLVTRLNMPAVVGIDEEVRTIIGDESIKINRVKQMIGHMVKQIMLQVGYEVENPLARCGKSRFFTTGTKFKNIKN